MISCDIAAHLMALGGLNTALSLRNSISYIAMAFLKDPSCAGLGRTFNIGTQDRLTSPETVFQEVTCAP